MGRQHILSLTSLISFACGSSSSRNGGADSAVSPCAPANMVTFAETHLNIEELEAPTPVPVLGSVRPSSENLTVDDPSVATVASSGALVGHRNGKTWLRGSGGVALSVTVSSVSDFSVDLSRSELHPLEEIAVNVRGQGAKIGPADVHWSSSDPRIAYVDGGRLHASRTPGRVLIEATYGDKSHRIPVLVVPPTTPEVEISPKISRLRVGELRKYEARTSTGPSTVEWLVSNPGVARLEEATSMGLLRGIHRGTTLVCARHVSASRSCVRLEVVP
jgi:hypothetical protein